MSTFRPDELGLDHDVVVFGEPRVPTTLSACDREPIHLSGAIQPHGVLLALEEPGLAVCQASANCRGLLGLEPAAALGAPLEAVLGDELAARLRSALDGSPAGDPGPIACRLTEGGPCELTWHRVDGLVVVELQPAPDAAPSMSGLFADVQHAMEALQHDLPLSELCDVAAREIRHLTGYDRVMVYRFHPDDHGEVVAEARRSDLEPFLGLSYPASDIPRQARKLYLLNHLRVIVDVDYEPQALMGGEAEGAPLDLSLAGLRSVSPMHLAYLRNMGVRATLTISLVRGTQLWGMFACHHDSPKRVLAQVRAACRLLGQVLSQQVVASEEREHHAYRSDLARAEADLVARMSGAASLAEALVADDLALGLTAADALVACIDGKTVSVGRAPPLNLIEGLLRGLRAQPVATPLISAQLTGDHPWIMRSSARAAGVVALPLSPGFRDYLLWFRGEYVHEVTWAGRPDKGELEAATGPPASTPATLSPRDSFASWAQEVRGTCRPWLAAEIESAQGLAAAVPELMLARARDELARLALHDPLTGLPNRALLFDRSQAALTRMKREGGEVAVLFLDLDRFKLVNDRLGHAAGDSLLRQAAERITATVRETDTVARLGGDEFVVLCEKITPQQANELAERVRDAFRIAFVIDGDDVSVTLSIGLVTADDQASPVGLLRDADSAMYRAKHSGRDATASFTHDMRAVGLRRVEIETGLRPALDRGDLRLDFQPIYGVAGELIGFEALARWPLHDRGMVPPDEFIAVAEGSGLIVSLTAWVLEEGITALAGWRLACPDLELTLAVNITAQQLSTDELQEEVDAVLLRHHLPSSALCLEITERALVSYDGSSQRFLEGMRSDGLRLSIDDFGTGFSSLAYLTKLPVDELKIDRAFVAGLPGSQRDVAVVAALVGLGHQLHMQVLAEGVETDEQLDLLGRLGCDRMQGFLLGRPMSARDVDRLLLPLA